MTLAVRIAGLIGLAAIAVLLVREGAEPVVSALSGAGWILLLLVPLHALPLLLDVLGWRTLLAAVCPQRTPGLLSLFGIAAVREAVNRLLPVANIGGEVVGVRLLVLRGVPVAVGGASVVVEVLVTIVAQFVFLAFGVLAVMRVAGAAHLATDLAFGLLMALPLLAALVVLLGYGSVFERLGKIARPLLGSRVIREPFDPAALDAQIRHLYRARRRLIGTLAWQLAGLCAGIIETWCALRWLGSPVSPSSALAFESVTQAVRHFVFFVPAGLGVQEGGLLALGHLLGVGSDAALALSIVKRMREILFGAPALLAWQWHEGRGLLRALSSDEAKR